MVADCLFCKIANRQMGTEFVFADDTIVAFKDIYPQAPVHLLIVPVRHIRSINDLADADRDLVSDMIMRAKSLAKTFEIDGSGYKLLFNVEKGGGQMIFHLHLHLMGGW